jgi:hypothetical protein
MIRLLFALASLASLSFGGCSYEEHVASRQVGIIGYAKDDNFGAGLNYRIDYR